MQSWTMCKRHKKVISRLHTGLGSTHFGNLCLSFGLLNQVRLIEHDDHVTTCDLTNHQTLHNEGKRNCNSITVTKLTRVCSIVKIFMYLSSLCLDSLSDVNHQHHKINNLGTYRMMKEHILI